MFNVGESSSSYFSWHIQPVYAISGMKGLMNQQEFSCSLVHFLKFFFKNGPKYHTRRTAQVFIHLMRFLQYSLVWSSFLVLQRYSFLNFFLSYLLVRWSLLPIFPSTCNFLFLRVIFSWFWNSIPYVICRFLLLIISMAHFSMPHSIPDCISSLPVLRFPIIFYFWQTVWCRLCTLRG